MAFILKRAQSGLGHIGDAVEGVSRAHRRVFSTDLRNASSSPPPLPVSAGKPVLDGPVRKRFVASLWWEKKWAMGELLLTATSFFFVGKAHEPFSMQVRADDIVWVRKKKSVWIVPMIKIRTKMCSKSVVFRVDNKLLAFQALEQLWKGQETADLERQAANAAAEKEMKAAMKQIAARYDLVQLLGHGSFGSTFIVQDKEDLRQYVLKRVTCKNQEDVYAAMREMLILKLLKHPYIVAYRNFWQDNLDIYIVMEYCEGGDLEAMKKQHALAATTFTESEILRWFSQVALAIDYMHDHNIIHRDIKPLNIFVSRWNGAKLGDFGLSVSREGTSKDDAVAGTFAYLAPEILNQKKAPSPKSDVYALGCSLYELLTLRTAYDDKQTGLFPQPLPDAFSKDLRDLVMQMIHEDPDRRPSVKHILKNHLVQDTLPAIKVESEMFSELQQRDDEIQLLLLKLRILRSKAGLQGNSLLDIPITTMEEELASALLSDDDGLAIVANASTGPGSQPQPMPHTTSAPPEMLVVPPAAVAPPPSSGSPRLQSLPRQSSASGTTVVPKLIPPKHRRTPSSSTSASPGAGAAPLGTSGGSLTSSMEEKDFAAASAAPDVTRNPIEAFLSVHWPLLIPASLPATGSFLSMVSAFLTAVVLYNHQGKLLSFVALLLASLPSVALAAFFTNTPHYIYSAILLVAVGCVPALAGVLTTPTKRAEIGTTSCVLSSALSLVYLLRLHTLLAGVLVTAAFAAALFLSPIVVPKISALSKRFGSCCTPLEVQQAATALWLQCAAYAILLVVSLIYPLVAWSSVPLLLLSLASMFTAVRVLNSPSATVYRAAFPYLLGGSVALLAACRLYGELEAQAAHM